MVLSINFRKKSNKNAKYFYAKCYFLCYAYLFCVISYLQSMALLHKKIITPLKIIPKILPITKLFFLSLFVIKNMGNIF